MITPKPVFLSSGGHESRFAPDGTPTVCATEFIAYLANEPFSDHPRCVSPVLGAFSRSLNDGLPDGDRQKMRPYLARMVGTAGDGQDEKRSLLALDWLVRRHAPAALAAAGLADAADKLRGLAAIEGMETAEAAAKPSARAARAACPACGSRDLLPPWPRRWECASCGTEIRKSGSRAGGGRGMSEKRQHSLVVNSHNERSATLEYLFDSEPVVRSNADLGVFEFQGRQDGRLLRVYLPLANSLTFYVEEAGDE